MTYLALARKWRPRSFEALLGQGMLVQALTNALTQQRLHHAYLFTGSHGIGKTSVARLFAKALNCEQGISATPCLACSTCISIEQGCFIDLLEIDGASKTRVEETRDLLENVQYLPSCGRFKIYLIDEVHMLSQHSFNALLKTLEEPPAHVKFLLATTDPQKLPSTIISRCLQFHLKPLPQDLIQQHLGHVLTEEGYEAEDDAIAMLAAAARGSMRDGLSLLEQALACASPTVTAAAVKTMLGYTQQNEAIRLLDALANDDATQLLAISDAIAAEGGHYTYVLEALLHEVYELAKLKHVPTYQPSRMASKALLAFVDRFAPETIQLHYQILLKGLADLKLAPHPRIGFEMCLLRLLAFQPALRPPGMPSVSGGALRGDTVPDVGAPSLTSGTAGEAAAVKEAVETTVVVGAQENTLSWPDLINTLSLTGMALNAARQAELEAVTEQALVLKITASHESLFTTNVIKQLEKASSVHFNRSMKVFLKVVATAVTTSPAARKTQASKQAEDSVKAALQVDPVFQTLQQVFEATVIESQ